MKVMRSVIINAPVDEVWATVRNFDGVVNWNPGVKAARMESGAPTTPGSIRYLDTADGNVIRETLLAHSDAERFYSYDIIESPLPCSNYVSEHRFIEITEGNMTLGIWSGTFDCAPEVESKLGKIVGDGIYRDGMLGLDRYMREQNHD